VASRLPRSAVVLRASLQGNGIAIAGTRTADGLLGSSLSEGAAASAPAQRDPLLKNSPITTLFDRHLVESEPRDGVDW